MNKTTKLFLLCIILLLTGIGLYLTPYFAVYNMKKAAENKDADALSDYIDYPSLRENLKANIGAKIAGEIAKMKDGNPFGVFGLAFAALLINPMIDALITPESVAMLMKGEKPILDGLESSSGKESLSEKSEIEISRSYKGFDRFVVKVRRKGSSEEPVELIFRRHGLISWKLSGLRMP
ncbi:MAG: DUF2939 domain-containing protein [Deltaproteobacteria bacterium]|nr:DUF2939 domain-containing protein [Deltaproteobacteria bacterium]